MSDNKRIFSSCFLPSLTSAIRTKRTSRRMNGSLFNFCNPPSDFSSVQAATASPHGFSSDSVSPAGLQSSRKNYTMEFKATVVFPSTLQLPHTTNALNFYTCSHNHVFFSSGQGVVTKYCMLSVFFDVPYGFVGLPYLCISKLTGCMCYCFWVSRFMFPVALVSSLVNIFPLVRYAWSGSGYSNFQFVWL